MRYQCSQCRQTIGPVTTLCWCPTTRTVATLLAFDTDHTTYQHRPDENVGQRDD